MTLKFVDNFCAGLVRAFDTRGAHVGDGIFPVALPPVLSVHFPEAGDEAPAGSARQDPTASYVSLHWSGDSDMDDTRLWVHSSFSDGRTGVRHVVDLSVHNAFELIRYGAE